MRKNKNNFKILINFLDNYKTKIYSGLVYVNLDQEDDWVLLENNSLASYDYVLIKIKDLNNKEEKYCFLKNANIIIRDNVININNSNRINFYKKSNQKINNKNSIKETEIKFNLLESMQKLGLNIDQYIELNELKNKLYTLKMQKLFNLDKEEKYE